MIGHGWRYGGGECGRGGSVYYRCEYAGHFRGNVVKIMDMVVLVVVIWLNDGGGGGGGCCYKLGEEGLVTLTSLYKYHSHHLRLHSRATICNNPFNCFEY